MFARLCFLLFALLWMPMSAAAQEKQELTSSLEHTTQALKAAKQQNKAVRRKREHLQQELGRLQKEMVHIAGKIQKQEQVLLELESGLAELKEEERTVTDTLLERHKDVAPLVQTMIQLSRIPPEIVIAMPGDFHETFHTAKVLGLTSAALSKNTENIRIQLAEIRTLQGLVAENHRAITTHKTMLERNQNMLDTKISARGRIHDQLHTREQAQTAELAKLSETSNNLKDLLNRLEAHREAKKGSANTMAIIPKDKPEAAKKAAAKPAAQGSGRFAKAKGKISLPAEGKIISFYGDKTETGDINRGITLRTRKRAKVVAPFDGEVVYTGPFMAYGNLIILRHTGGHHTLLAGLEQVSSQTGQRVLKGEPVGDMGNSKQATALYMELREDNRPVDPMPWIDTKRRIAGNVKHKRTLR